MGGKVHLTKEEKFLQSLKSWGEDFDNRPFIRIKIDEVKDKIVIEKRRKKILEEKLRISKITGDPVENIHLFDSMGHEYSREGNIREFTIKE